MGFILSLLPGLRELRTPLISGSLWLIVFLTTGWVDLSQLDSYIIANTDLDSYFSLLQPALILGTAFLLGLLAQSLVTPSIIFAGVKVRRALVWVDNHSHKAKGGETALRRPRFIFKLIGTLQLNLWPLSYPARRLLIDATKNRITSAIASSDMALAFPTEAAIEALPHCAAQLTQSAPIQYQEFDRLKSEVDIRVAIAPPLLAIACTLPVDQREILVTIGIVVTFILLIQAVGRERRAMDILANAAYLGYIDIPIIKAVTEGLGALPVTPKSDYEWRAGLIIALENRGYFWESDSVLREVFHICQQIGGESEVAEYLKAHSLSAFEVWERLGKDITSEGETDKRNRT